MGLFILHFSCFELLSLAYECIIILFQTTMALSIFQNASEIRLPCQSSLIHERKDSAPKKLGKTIYEN